MSDYSTLKTAIDANINTNGNQEITGAVLNSVMNLMVDTIQEQTDEQFAELDGNVGVSDYPEFSASTSYVIGDVVRYNGILYEFTSDHAAGDWLGTDVSETSIKERTDNKLTELESIIGDSSRSFYVPLGSNHSSKSDQIIINGKVGDIIEVSTKSTADASDIAVAFWGYLADGTNDQIAGAKVGETIHITLSKDYEKIGVYVAYNENFSHTITFHAKFALVTGIEQIKSRYGIYAYFASYQVPTFAISDDVVSVTFPSTDLRIYRDSGEVVVETNADGQTFTINYGYKLVINAKTKVIAVKSFREQEPYDIVLLTNNTGGEVVGGLLKPYYDRYVLNRELNLRGYFTGPSTPIITRGNNYDYTIVMPENSGLRIYGNSGILTNIPIATLGKEYHVESLSSLVYSLDTNVVQVKRAESKTEFDIVLFETLGTGDPLGVISQYYQPKFQLEKQQTLLDNRSQIVTYFSSASKPTFNFLEDNSVVVTLPSAGGSLRLYDRKDNTIKGITILQDERVFTIPLYSALIVDVTEGKLKIIDLTDSEIQSNDTYILLFNKSVGIGEGLFSAYFNKFIEQRNTWSIQDSYSNYDNNISVEHGAITIRNGFSLVNGIGRYGIKCTNDYIIKSLDDVNGTRVTRTFVYIDTFILGATTYLDGENAKNVFVIKSTQEANSSGRYLLFATFYYQTPCGGMIDVYRNSINGSVLNLYKNKIQERNQCKFRSDFNCLLFSDIHASTSNLQRIVELANNWGSNYIDVILNGGDTASNQVTDGYDWYNQLVDKSSIDVLAAAGNHDEWINENWNWAESSIVYNAIVAPIVSKVDGLVQPTNAATEGKLYYYKDYGKVRVIVLEPTSYGTTIPYWDSAQNVWMQSILEDARVNGLAVICMAHPPFAKEDGKIDESITFNSWAGYRIDVVDDKTSMQHDPLAVVDEALTNIDSFINNGGKFICWIAGHTHLDYFVQSMSHPKQVMFVTASANYARSKDCEPSSDKSSPMYDCMTYIGIDLDKSWLKILRVGRNLDGFLREKNVLVYDLNNHRVITNW